MLKINVKCLQFKLNPLQKLFQFEQVTFEPLDFRKQIVKKIRIKTKIQVYNLREIQQLAIDKKATFRAGKSEFWAKMGPVSEFRWKPIQDSAVHVHPQGQVDEHGSGCSKQ